METNENSLQFEIEQNSANRVNFNFDQLQYTSKKQKRRNTITISKFNENTEAASAKNLNIKESPQNLKIKQTNFSKDAIENQTNTTEIDNTSSKTGASIQKSIS